MTTLARWPVSSPIPPEWSVGAARDAYLAENGFTLEAYDERWTKAKVFGITYGVPNTAHHRWAIMLHDLHHVATGFGTDLRGEGEISGWELAGGLRPLGLYIGCLILLGTLAGLLIAPRRTLRAYRAGGTNLLTPGQDADDLLTLSVGDLRERLGIPREGLAAYPRGLNEGAPRPAARG